MKTIITLNILFYFTLALGAEVELGPKEKILLDTSAKVVDYTEKYGDTTAHRQVYEIDGHLVIIDSIKVEKEKVKPVVKEKLVSDPAKKIVGLLALLFAVLAIYNAKRKNKQNEPKN